MDEVDIANDEIQSNEDSAIRRIRELAATIPKGYAGTCDECDKPFPRIVGGKCAKCRDTYEIYRNRLQGKSR